MSFTICRAATNFSSAAFSSSISLIFCSASIISWAAVSSLTSSNLGNNSVTINYSITNSQATSRTIYLYQFPGLTPPSPLNLTNATLTGATITNTDFTNVNITGANITGVNFSNKQKLQLLKIYENIE